METMAGKPRCRYEAYGVEKWFDVEGLLLVLRLGNRIHVFVLFYFVLFSISVGYSHYELR